MTDSAHVYELVTQRRIRPAPLRLMVLSIIDVRRAAAWAHWLVAVTSDQAAVLRDVPWILSAKPRGKVKLDGQQLVFSQDASGRVVTFD